MSITKFSLKGLVATLSISPAPSTLTDSTAILRKLRTFGHVTYFRKLAVPAHETDQNNTAVNAEDKHQGRYNVVYFAADGLQSAVSASPFTVSVNENIPNPVDLDPYDIRGLQSRKPLESREYKCEFKLGASPGNDIDKIHQTVFYGPFKSTMKHPEKIKVQGELAEAGAPLSILEGLAISAELAETITVSNEDVKSVASSDQRYTGNTGAWPVSPEPPSKKESSSDRIFHNDLISTPHLMDMYRTGGSPKSKQEDVDKDYNMIHASEQSSNRRRLPRRVRHALRLAQLQRQKDDPQEVLPNSDRVQDAK